MLLSTISLVFVWFYWKWIQSDRSLFYWGMLAMYALACNTEWPGYLLAAAAMLHYRYALKLCRIQDAESVLLPVSVRRPPMAWSISGGAASVVCRI